MVLIHCTANLDGFQYPTTPQIHHTAEFAEAVHARAGLKTFDDQITGVKRPPVFGKFVCIKYKYRITPLLIPHPTKL